MTNEQRAAQFLLRLYELSGGDITVRIDFSEHQTQMGLGGLDRGQWNEVIRLLGRQGYVAFAIGKTTARITAEGIDAVRRLQS